MNKPTLFAAAWLLGTVGTAHAVAIVPGFNSNTLAACDDCSTAAVSLGFSAYFFGTSYANTYVSNNGYVTFNTGQGTYTPTGLTASYSGQPIIAPFYADVDTTGVGTVTYGSGTYNGNQAFGVTWNNVGYFPSATDKTNTFQMLLVNRADVSAGAFDIIYNYGSIQWETGSASGGTNGFGGFSAAVGYANGTGAAGTYYQLPGSLVPGSFLNTGTNALITGSNDGTPGQYAFEVRNGVVSAVPLPASLWLMLSGICALATFGPKRKRIAHALFESLVNT